MQHPIPPLTCFPTRGRFGRWGARLLGAALLLGSTLGARAQNINAYVFSQSTSTYAPITGGSVVGTATSDDQQFNDPAVPAGNTLPAAGPGLPVGFTFQYDGLPYNVFAINNNGWIALGNSSAGATAVTARFALGSNYYPLSNTNTPPTNAIAPLARDLQAQATSEIRYQTTGTAPNRTLVVQFTNYRKYAGTGEDFNFQIRLNETSNTVAFAYGTVTPSTATSVEVGLRGATAADFNNRTTTTDWSASTAGVSGDQMTLTTTVFPASGLTYTFTPSTCFSPSALTVSAITTTGATVGFTAPSTTATGYAYRYRLAGSTGAYTTGTLAAGATSVVLTGLTAGLTYEFGIQSNCSATTASNFATTRFSTNCLAFAAPFSTNFDLVTAPALPNCFSSILQGGGTGAAVRTVNSTVANSAPNFVEIYPNSASATANVLLVSPQFSDLGGGNARQVRFFARNSGTGPTLQVGVLTDPADPATFTAVGPVLTLTSTFTEYNVVLTGYTGSGKYVGLKALSPSSAFSTVYVDDFFYEVPPACGRPTAVSVGSIAGVSASVSFSPGNGNTSYTVTATPTTGTAITATGTGSPIALTGLSTGTTYTLTVTGNCAAGATAVSTPVVTFATTILNDDPAGAIIIPITATCTTPTNGTNVGATTTTPNGYANAGCGIASSPIDVWYKFTTAATGPTATAVQINITGNPAGQVRVFSAASAAGPFTQVGCSAGTTNNTVAPSFFVNNLTPSTTYYIFVSGYGSGDTTGPFTLCVTTPPALPTITSFTPTGGPAGTVVVITGTNFTGATAVNFFGGVSAPGFVVNAAGTQITVTVPAGVFTGPITVVTPASSVTSATSFNSGNASYLIGTNQTTCSGNIFDSGGPNGQYQNNENLTTVLTPATAGAKINLLFTAFDVENSYDNLTIYDGPSAASPQLVLLTGTTLPGSVTATNPTGQLTLVFTSDGSVPKDGFAAAISCVTNVPGVVSFTPASGLPGTSVVITGTNFTGATAVSFNNVAAPGFVVNAAGTQITVNVPVGATTGRIRVQVSGVIASSGTDFVVPAPTITSFTPTTGPAGTSVVITGTGFTGTTAVTFGGVNAPVFVVNSATQITVTVPANAFTGTISVTTPAGMATSTGIYNSGNAAYLIGVDQTTCSGNIFDSGGPNGQYQNSETLTTVLTPATPGAKLQLLFSAFDLENNYDFLEVRNGPLATSPLIGRYTGLLSASTSPGTGPIVATNPTGQLTLIFTSDGSVPKDGFAAGISCIVNPTTVTSFTPTSGPAGTVVVLTGTFFTGATSVLFNGTPATTFTVNSATQITVTVPPSALSGPISVITPTGGVGVSTTIFNTGNFVVGTNATTCSAALFDSGGPNGDYQNSENLTSVLRPSTPGAKVSLTFSSFNLGFGDNLKIYDGTSANAPLLGTFAGTTNPGTITATTFTGELTVVFMSDGFTTGPGFVAAISCTAPATCTPVTNLTVSNVTASTAVVSFTAGVGNNSYVVSATPIGGGPTITVTPNPTASPVTITGLTGNINYTVSVLSNCTTGGPVPATTATIRTLLPNDEAAGAVVVPITANCTTPTQGDNTTATTSTAGVPIPGCSGANAPKDIWYKFTTATTGATATAVAINTTGTAAGQVRVFSAATSAGPFTSVGCSAGTGPNTKAPNFLVPGLTANTTYYIAVSGFGSADLEGPFTICLTQNVITGTHTALSNGELNVYPNPAQQRFTLTLPAIGGTRTAQLTLLNALGQTVLTQTATLQANGTQVSVDVAGLATGLYTLRVQAAGQSAAVKVAVSH